MLYLCQQHEGIVWGEVPLQEIHTMLLQGGHSILLGRVQSRHHRFWSNLHFVAAILKSSFHVPYLSHTSDTNHNFGQTSAILWHFFPEAN
jgi:hypothetical protein